MTKKYGQAGPPQLHAISSPITDADMPILRRSPEIAHLLEVDACWYRSIRCTCDADALHVLRADSDDERWVTGRLSGDQRVCIQCPKCHEVRLLFDDGLHGYNAVICDERADLSSDYERNNDALLKQFKCPCGNASLHLYAAAVYDCLDPQDSEDISEDLWDDAYGYFVAIAVCPCCSGIYEIASAETA